MRDQVQQLVDFGLEGAVLGVALGHGVLGNGRSADDLSPPGR